MKTQIKLEIKKPCSENFNAFQKTKKGGFCNSCEKEVIDFSKMTSNEIISYFKENSTNKTCGKFDKSQFESLSKNKQPRKKLSFFGGFGLACLSFFTFGTLHAQEKPVSKQIKQLKATVNVEGTVSDASGPLPGVSIVLQGTTKGTETNFDGKFKFPQSLKKGDVLIFSYIGYKTQKIVIDGKNTSSKIVLDVNFKNEDVFLMGAVDVKQIYKSKKKSN